MKIHNMEEKMAEVDVCSDLIIDRQKYLSGILKKSFENHDRKTAKESFGLIAEYERINDILEKYKDVFNPEIPTVFLDSWFLEELIVHLTPQENEEVSYITGQYINNLFIPYRICDITLESQSPVYAQGTARSCMDVLININRRGFKLLIMAHSHPGRGPWATMPSSIDTGYLGTIQKTGADVLGAIVTRDGHVGFFSVFKDFDIVIQGNGVEYVDKHVCKIALPCKDKNKKNLLSWR